MEEYTYKKSVCERYDLLFNRGDWAMFTIDEKAGLLGCHSSYGDYSYAWPNHGRETFKHFLIEITRSPGYLLNKVSDRTYFDFDKTIDAWKERIVGWRKDGSITKEQARDAYDDICKVDEGSPDYVLNQISDSEAINATCGGCVWEDFECVMEYPHDAKVFVEQIMPMLAEVLKEEIEKKESE